mmetsp:Transcript_22278/g.33192  ORF Transcript_22278/g.33192 Transcript_22278/m.33192 type:complete len:233 (+) Transcript_22278:430-1128(+)
MSLYLRKILLLKTSAMTRCSAFKSAVLATSSFRSFILSLLLHTISYSSGIHLSSAKTTVIVSAFSFSNPSLAATSEISILPFTISHIEDSGCSMKELLNFSFKPSELVIWGTHSRRIACVRDVTDFVRFAISFSISPYSFTCNFRKFGVSLSSMVRCLFFKPSIVFNFSRNLVIDSDSRELNTPSTLFCFKCNAFLNFLNSDLTSLRLAFMFRLKSEIAIFNLSSHCFINSD